jgi:hypothetical protein
MFQCQCGERSWIARQREESGASGSLGLFCAEYPGDSEAGRAVLQEVLAASRRPASSRSSPHLPEINHTGRPLPLLKIARLIFSHC